MKKTVLMLFVVVSTMLSSVATAQMKFLKGRDYRELKNPLPLQVAGKPEVIEFFSYACPHCANLHPTVVKWKNTQKPADVTFFEVPALGGMWTFVARVKYTAKKLGLSDDFDAAYFQAIHNKRQRRLLGDKDTAFKFIAEHGNVGIDAIEKAWNSLQVKRDMQRSETLFNASGLSSVPAVVVNGRYVVTINQPEKTFDVVNFLLATTQP